MAKRRRKDTHCLNCLTELVITDSFCSACGQENTNNKVPLMELVRDVISNYFNLDTRFGRAIIPFLFKPGSLTVDFNLGHRLKYMHPLKLYVMMSLLYFFVFSWFTMPEIEEYLSYTVDTGKKIETFAKENGGILSELDSLGNIALDSSEQALETLQQRQAVADSLLGEEGDISFSLNINENDIEESSLTGIATFNQFLELIQNREMTPENLLDSLEFSDANKKDAFLLKIAEQTLKIGRNDPHIFAANIIDNIPVMMLFLLPLLAMYLKLIYIRSSNYYIEHLIFTLHIQAFVYFIFALGLLSIQWVDAETVFLLMGLLIFVYSFAMFRRVYKQNWFKTFIKMHIMAFLYLFSLLIFFVFEILASFLIF